MRKAVYCGTRNLYHDMAVSAKSLLYNDGADKVYFLIEDDTFPEHLPASVETMNVSDQQVFLPSSPNYHTKWTYMILIRALLADIFDHDDRILSLDVDTITNGSIDTIWRTDLTGKYYAAVREIIPGNPSLIPAYNFGVVLLNLAMLRDGTSDKIVSLLNTHKLTCPEQDAYNTLCNGHIAELPPEYNATYYNSQRVPDCGAKIKHFANDIPMNTSILYRKYNKLSWDAVLAHQKSIQKGVNT